MRFPTFSTNKIPDPRNPISSRCFTTIRASRWQVPPVTICRTGNPYFASRFASLSVCKSPVHTSQQWTPELAAPLSRCDLAIFLDASARFSPGFVHCESVRPHAGEAHAVITHSCTPSLLLRLSHQLYIHVPQRGFLVTIDAQSFAFSYCLSPPVQRAIPVALSRIHSILAGATYPPSVTHALSAD
jgi:Ni,Fe-hydrogenase maturation factor